MTFKQEPSFGLFFSRRLKILAKIKAYGIPIALILFGLSAFFYGAHVERLEANEEIAQMEKEYAIRESSALWEAETIRKQQEQKYLLEMDRFKLLNSELAADALRVRELFAQVQSTRSPDLERSHLRIERCERLLSEAYELAGEGEGLLRERDVRLDMYR